MARMQVSSFASLGIVVARTELQMGVVGVMVEANGMLLDEVHLPLGSFA